jgi:hypothetical protein
MTSQQYFLNLEACGADSKTIRTYRALVDPFIEDCQLNPRVAPSHSVTRVD